jgi:hypothetical protein
LKRLGIADLDVAGKTVIGTSLGMGEADKGRAKTECTGKISLVPDDCYKIITERMQ